ncbi:MAG: hypothetical protein ACE5MM_01155 [Nitrospiraceae bacterium]
MFGTASPLGFGGEFGVEAGCEITVAHPVNSKPNIRTHFFLNSVLTINLLPPSLEA